MLEVRYGVVMTASVLVSSLVVNDGTLVPIPESGVVLFVGPNNAGKSQALRDISKIITSGDQSGVVVAKATVDFSGSVEELHERFLADRTIVHSATAGDRVNLGDSGAQTLANISNWWSGSARHVVAAYFVRLADTESRLNASKPTVALNLFEENPTHSLHRMYLQPDLEDRLNEISRSAFGQGVILDVWAGGSQWALRVGGLERPNSPRPDHDYLEALRSLPLLHEQGDGVRSMLGLLLDLLTGHQTVSLIDEPEAFLHPPQARFLAKLLALDAMSQGRTAFLGTHSSDIVHGTLEGPTATTVVRLVRKGAENRAAVLDNDAVRRLWSDPLLRYSNLLEGLFTDAVVVCESDADCKFFASIRDTLEDVGTGERRPDILFTSCGGKHRMHLGLEALRAASVPVVVVGDFDVLNEWATVSRLIVSAGGDPAGFEADWKTLNSALTSKTRTPSVAGMREAVMNAFKGVEQITSKALEPVKEALKIEDGWGRVKNSGLAGVPKGGPFTAAKRLLEQLRDIGIHLIPVGEMEDFVPGVGGHGPGWLADVLEQRLHESTETDDARNFVRAVLDAISRATGAPA